MFEARAPRVFLVGAGPGDPGLLTLRALECLAQAELVIYDQLVPTRLLDFASAAAQRLCVSELPGHRQERWQATQRLVIEAAAAGRTVVRLKGGDPMIFGRGAEECAELRRAGIPFEVVPGITALSAAAAAIELSLTHRVYSSAVAVVTGHEDPTKPQPALDWSALAAFPGTLSIYMGMTRLDSICRVLIQRGKAADTPAAVISWAGTGEQRRVLAALASLPSAVRAAGLRAPAVIVVGAVAGQSPVESWFEQRPLFGLRVLVTRPRDQASELVRKLELLGAIPSVLPAIRIEPLEDWSEVDARLERLDRYDWLVFTSSNGVRAFFGRLRSTGRDLRALGGVQLAAIGPGTAAELRRFHLDADVVPSEYRSEALAAALINRVAGRRVLLVRANRGRDILPLELAKVAEVDQVAAYRQVDAVTANDAALAGVRSGAVDYVTLTSANMARAFLRPLDPACAGRIQDGQVRLATISPVTTEAVIQLGYQVDVEARVHTIDGLIRALVERRLTG